MGTDSWLITTRKVFTGLLLTLALTQAQSGSDRYPEVRAILTEVEIAAAKIGVLRDKNNALSSVAFLYARAGYLDDAFRVAAMAGMEQGFFTKAQTLYGDLPGARRVIGAVQDPVSKSALLSGVADTLWRMGDAVNARTLLLEAEQVASKIVAPSRRKVQLQMIAQLTNALPSTAPIPLSATPYPRPRKSPESPASPFPITVDGFRKKTPEAIANDSLQNGAFLTELYAFAVAGDREGLLKHTAHAVSTFQKTMAFATIEHLLIQIGEVAEAESYARKIPEDQSDCALARVEALSAAAVAWARAGNTEQAQEVFDDALETLASVGPDLAFGKAVVAAAVATAQSEAGFVATSSQTFELSLKLAQHVPLRPKPVKGVYKNTYFGRSFRDDAFGKIFDAALRIHNLSAARRTVAVWASSNDSDPHVSIVNAWFHAGRKDEAIAHARGISDVKERVSALEWLARNALDEAGGPLL